MKARKGTIFITLGLLLLAAALFLAGFNRYDNQRAQQSAGQILAELEKELPPEHTPESSVGPDSDLQPPNYVLYPELEMPVETIDGTDYIGVLRIPALELELPVISQWSYPGLRTAPCRYSGSAYQSDLIICGHNYPAHFGNLKLLQEGDTITFTDVDGNVFTYRVTLIEILEPTAVEEMERGDWDLTLFTCTLGGQTRFAIRCMLARD